MDNKTSKCIPVTAMTEHSIRQRLQRAQTSMFGKCICGQKIERGAGKTGLRETRGSMAVETAIFLPLFLIGLLTLGFLIRLAAIEENVYHTLSDETHRIAAEAQLPARAPFFSSDVEKRILEENSDVDHANTSIFLFRVPYYSQTSGRSYSDLIGVTERYHVRLGIPAIFRSGVEGASTVLLRAFTGRDNSAQVLPFSKMEEDDDANLVWVFPRAGEKYHGHDCRFVSNEASQLMLTATVKRQYTPCELCKPEDLPYGSLVYAFTGSGKAYHTGSCFIVFRYVVSMSEQDAISAGYAACGVCGGK